MVKTIIDVSMYAFEALLFYFYCQTAFKHKYHKLLNLGITAAAYAALFFVYKIGNIYLNAGCNIIFCFLLLYFLYEVKWTIAIMHSFLFYLFLMASEYVTIPLISIAFQNGYIEFPNNEYSYLLVVVISKLIHLICCMVLLKGYKLIKDKESLKGFSLMLIVPISDIVILELIYAATKELHFKQEMYRVWVISGILMLISSILVFVNRNTIIKQSEKINELNLENHKKEMDAQYLAVLKKSNDDMRVLAHDFKNHLAQLNSLASVDDVRAYISKIYPEVEAFVSAGISDNKTLDLIISKYYSICEMKGIHFDVDVRTSNLSQIESVDLSALLNNLLDNAVEAAQGSEQRQIHFKAAKHTAYYDKITIINSCAVAPKEGKRGLITAKPDKALHGIGLKSVRKIVKKYNGVYQWQYDAAQKCFTTTVSIPR